MRKFLLFLSFLGCLLLPDIVRAACDAPISLTATLVSHELCLGGGEIRVTSISPAAPTGSFYQYQLWNVTTNTEAKTWQDQDLFTGGIGAGTYRVNARLVCPGSPTATISNVYQNFTQIVIQNQLAPAVLDNIVSGGDPNCCAAFIDVSLYYGRGPFAFSLVSDLSSNPTVIRPEQSSPVFTGLCEGTYYVKLRDGCNGTTVKAHTIAPAPSGVTLIGESRMYRYGCDSFVFEVVLTDQVRHLGNTRRWITWPNGTSEYILPEYEVSNDRFHIPFNLAKFSNTPNLALPFPQNVGNGPWAFTISMRDTCGDTTSATRVMKPSPDGIYLKPGVYSYETCDEANVGLVISHKNDIGTWDPAFEPYPVTSKVHFNNSVFYKLGSGTYVPLTGSPAWNDGFGFTLPRPAGGAIELSVAYCLDTVTVTLPATSVPNRMSDGTRHNKNLTFRGCAEGTIRRNDFYNNPRTFSTITSVITWTNSIYTGPRVIQTSGSNNTTLFRNLPLGSYEITTYDTLTPGCTPDISVDTFNILLEAPRIFSMQEDNSRACVGRTGINLVSSINNTINYYDITFEVLEQPANSNLPTILVDSFKGQNEVPNTLRSLLPGRYRFRVTDSIRAIEGCFRSNEVSVELLHPRNPVLSFDVECGNNLIVKAIDSVYTFGVFNSTPFATRGHVEIYDTATGQKLTGVTSFSSVTSDAGSSKHKLRVADYNSIFNTRSAAKFRYFNNTDGRAIYDSCTVYEEIWTYTDHLLNLNSTFFYNGCATSNDAVIVGGVTGGVPPYRWTLFADLLGTNVVRAEQTSNVFTGLSPNTVYYVKVADACQESKVYRVANPSSIKLFASSNNSQIELCEGDSLTLTVPLLDGATYEWIGPNAQTLGTGNQLFIPTVTSASHNGSYFVRVTLGLGTTCVLTSDTYDISLDGINCQPLPVKLASFDAYALQNASALRWTTQSESNNKGFEIQHSTNASTWKAIGFVNSSAENGNSASKLQYDYKHTTPNEGVNYYRLKQVDFDGASEYSKVVMVRFGANQSNITMYPNPANTEVTLKGLEGNEIITIYDVMGRTVLRTNATQSELTIPLEKLVSGTYTVQVKGTKDVKSLSLIKNAID